MKESVSVANKKKNQTRVTYCDRINRRSGEYPFTL